MGPLATQILGDLGADVITIESRDGDISRTMSSGPVRGLSGVSLNLLRNKRNAAIDISQPAGRSALLRVASGCDVFVTNLRSASLRRAGLEHADIAAVRPDVIYCQATGFASGSYEADKPALDDIIQAANGVPAPMPPAPGGYPWLGLPPARRGAGKEHPARGAGFWGGEGNPRGWGPGAGGGDRGAAGGRAPGGWHLKGDPAASQVLRHSGISAPPGSAAWAAHQRNSRRGRPERRGDRPAHRRRRSPLARRAAGSAMSVRADRAMSFGSIAADYDRLRPSPPPDAVRWLLPASCDVAVDLAAGTGLLIRALAGRAREVIAVEPDGRMAAGLRERSPGVHITAGRGEAIPLQDQWRDP